MKASESAAIQAAKGGVFRRIAGNTGIGLIGSGVLMVGTILRTVILGRSLDLDTFGFVVVCTNAVLVMRLIFRVGVGETLLRYVPDFLHNDDKEAVGSLLWLIVYLSVAVGALMLAIVYLFGGWAAQNWYHNPEITGPLILAVWMSAFFTLGEANNALLRFRNRFHLTIISGGVGSLVSLGLVWNYARLGVLDLGHAVLAVALADGVTIGCASLLWLFSARIWMRPSISQILLKPLRGHGRKIRSTLTQTSLLGILQSGSEVGGTFILGVLGTPAQVAVMGMANQLSRPIKMLQGSLGNAVTPEIHRMYAQGEYPKLAGFVRRYALISFVVIAVIVAVAFPLSYWLIPIVLKPEYLKAIPVFWTLAIAGALMIPFLPLLPVAVARHEMGQRNLVASLRLVYLGLASVLGLTAMGVALSQLAGSLSVRLMNDLPLYRRLRRHGDQAGANAS